MIAVEYGITRDDLATLKLAFKEDDLITAGNSSQTSDGASAVLIMSSACLSESTRGSATRT